MKPWSYYNAEAALLIKTMQDDSLFKKQRFDTHRIYHVSFEFQAPVHPLFEHLIGLIDLELSSNQQSHDPISCHKLLMRTFVLHGFLDISQAFLFKFPIDLEISP